MEQRNIEKYVNGLKEYNSENKKIKMGNSYVEKE